MATLAAFGDIHLMHGPVQSHAFAFFGAGQCMAFIAGIQVFMMTDPAGIHIAFVGFVIKGRKIHAGFGLYLFFAGFDQNRIRLVSFDAGDIFYLFDQGLQFRIMTSAALNRTCFFPGCNGFSMTVYAADVRSQSIGYTVPLCDFFVTVTAGAFFFLGMKQLFGYFVIFMVASLTFVFMRFGVAKVKGFVQAHGLANGDDTGFFLMAVSAGDRAGLFAFGCALLMAFDTPGMIQIHDLFF